MRTAAVLARRLASGDERKRHDHGALSGSERLLRELVLRGLSESALVTASMLVVELDRPRDADRIEPQSDSERLASRQRVAGEREVTGGRKQQAA